MGANGDCGCKGKKTMTDSERALKAQLDANTMALARTQQQLGQMRQQMSEYDSYDDGYHDQGPPPNDGYGNNVDTQKLIMQALTNQASKQAADQIRNETAVRAAYDNAAKTRMTRLANDFPALSQENSELVVRARQIYQRIAAENPTLDEVTRYELAVREAASAVGARPLSTPPEDESWSMPSSVNKALPDKQLRSRLTPAIVANARMLGIDVDPKTRIGQNNLKELSGYSERFNADQDESHVKYR